MDLITNNKNLAKIIEEKENIKSLKIGVAYFSDFGLQLLKNLIKKHSLKMEDIEIVLSRDFSSSNPSELLKELSNIAKIYIIREDILHSKIYFIESQTKNFLIFGSSNFTQGGFEKNLEFNGTIECTAEQVNQLEEYFDTLKMKALPLEDNEEKIIEIYKLEESNLRREEKKSKKIKENIKKNLEQIKLIKEKCDKSLNEIAKQENIFWLLISNPNLYDFDPENGDIISMAIGNTQQYRFYDQNENPRLYPENFKRIKENEIVFLYRTKQEGIPGYICGKGIITKVNREENYIEMKKLVNFEGPSFEEALIYEQLKKLLPNCEFISRHSTNKKGPTLCKFTNEEGKKLMKYIKDKDLKKIELS